MKAGRFRSCNWSSIFDRRVVLRVDEVEPLDLSALQRLESSGRVHDRLEDQLADVAGSITPVVLVAGHHQAVTSGPLLEHEGTSSRGMFGRVVARGGKDSLGVDLAFVGVVLLERLGARHGEARQGEGRNHRSGRLGEVESDHELLGGLAAFVQRRCLAVAEPAEHGLPVVARRRVLEGAFEVVPALEVEANGIRVEGLTVVEGHVLFKIEHDARGVLGDLPVLCETRNYLGGPRSQCDEALEHLVDGPQRLAVGHQGAVQHDGVCRGPERQRCVRLTTLIVASASATRLFSATGGREETQRSEEHHRSPLPSSTN